ncbi:MAG: tRNA threonylcarbamoyladenosine dehydratase [Eubacterium sp.]|nr:tRNA threonylcarbamoyladenosine dehydratase [Eubacterium sp.]
MDTQFSRTELLLGKENMDRLKHARVAVFGIGGVGGHVVEALVRSGVGTLDLIDNDTVVLSNLNRQIIATHKTLGMSKTQAAKERILDINPECVVYCHDKFYLPETAGEFDFTQYDYVVDAIDTVAGKISLVEQAQAADVPIISSMGAGNKMDPTAFKVADIYKTSVCPLAKVMRHELKKRGIKKLKVVYSEEAAMTPLKIAADAQENNIAAGGSKADAAIVGVRKRQTPGSNAFVPSVVGLIIAGEVVKDLTV